MNPVAESAHGIAVVEEKPVERRLAFFAEHKPVGPGRVVHLVCPVVLRVVFHTFVWEYRVALAVWHSLGIGHGVGELHAVGATAYACLAVQAKECQPRVVPVDGDDVHQLASAVAAAALVGLPQAYGMVFVGVACFYGEALRVGHLQPVSLLVEREASVPGIHRRVNIEALAPWARVVFQFYKRFERNVVALHCHARQQLAGLVAVGRGHEPAYQFVANVGRGMVVYFIMAVYFCFQGCPLQFFVCPAVHIEKRSKVIRLGLLEGVEPFHVPFQVVRLFFHFLIRQGDGFCQSFLLVAEIAQLVVRLFSSAFGAMVFHKFGVVGLYDNVANITTNLRLAKSLGLFVGLCCLY